MKFRLVKKDLFKVDNCYYAHCVSRDYALGAGIAVEFDKRYNMSKKLIHMGEKHPSTLKQKCVCIDNVLNLVTKEKYWHKPTYESLRGSLLEMKELIKQIMEYNELCGDDSVYDNINKIAMPKIGCGLDRLSWDIVEGMIKEIFQDLDIEIIVCYL